MWEGLSAPVCYSGKRAARIISPGRERLLGLFLWISWVFCMINYFYAHAQYPFFFFQLTICFWEMPVHVELSAFPPYNLVSFLCNMLLTLLSFSRLFVSSFSTFHTLLNYGMSPFYFIFIPLISFAFFFFASQIMLPIFAFYFVFSLCFFFFLPD